MKAVADLVYFPDSHPGIRREKRGRGWSYIAPDGTRIRDRTERARLDALAVPPAYVDVWMCPDPLGHLQATGRDARARKQYRYHPDWTAYRALAKFDHLGAFGAALPALRRRIRETLNAAEPGDHAFAIAAVLALLDRADIRVGNTGYARENKTFGATTLRPRHVGLDGDAIRLDFPGKGGSRVRKRLHDRTLERTLSRLDDLPGPTLVSWIDEGGAPRRVTSAEVNAFLSGQIGEAGITAKTFRTWTGSVVALETALAQEAPTIKALAEAAAARLSNTPTIARNSYIHPEVVAMTGESPTARAALARDAPDRSGLRKAEATLLHLLERSGRS